MQKESAGYIVAKAIGRVLMKIIYLYHAENGCSLPKDKGAVVCSNHIGAVDPALIHGTQNRLIHFMAKKELYKNKFAAKIITMFGAFPVDRGKDGGRAIHKGEELLNDDTVVGIFIEGTRSRSGELGKPHTGAIVMAHHTGKPIVPCCITGSKIFVKPFHRTKITYGEPVTCEQLGIKEGTVAEYRAAAAQIMEIIAGMREQHLREFEAPPHK